jgi:hexosaminidase
MPAIIPLPARLEQHPGNFELTDRTQIITDDANAWNAAFLHGLISPPTGYPLPVQVDSSSPAIPSIHLAIDPALAALGPEGYRLEITPATVDLRAPTVAGVFYGLQTLRQMLPVEVEERHPVTAAWWLPCALIEDQPRFAWRGFMLDDGRYFHGLETVLKTLDLMALQKLNRFHWHLTEDQGWRIEIKKYPLLTQVGSHRPGTVQSRFSRRHDQVPHAGFYTQEQIRTVVAYAARRHITVIPEIEMPGHSLAALAAYPELTCTGKPVSVANGFGIFKDIYCAGRQEVFTFLQDVLDEVLDLFPSPIIHIGGDEAPKQRWKQCPLCQRRIQAEHLVDEHALQAWFTNRIGDFLGSRGRRLMGWNQILAPGLNNQAVVHFWLGERDELVRAVTLDGRQFVMSTYLDTYLDHSYDLMPLSRAYLYEPVPSELTAEQSACILGLEAPLWSEWVPDRPRLDYQAYPRLTALAETAWTPKDRKDFVDFRRRLKSFLPRLARLGVHHAPLKEVEPNWLRQKLGVFTIPIPQRKTAP